MRTLPVLLLWACAAVTTAAPPPIPPAADHARRAAVAGDTLTVEPGKFADVSVDAPAGASVVWRFYPPPVQRADNLAPGRAIFIGKPGTSYVVTAVVIDFAKKSVTDTEFTVTFPGKAEPDPVVPPPAPPAPPVPPAPVPVTSFHVVMVYESGATYPSETKAVLFSPEIQAYLDANTTPDAGTKGWRRRDKDADVSNETAFQKALWADVRGQVTAPCWVVEVNKTAKIIELPATVADGLATLRRFKEGK